MAKGAECTQPTPPLSLALLSPAKTAYTTDDNIRNTDVYTIVILTQPRRKPDLAESVVPTEQSVVQLTRLINEKRPDRHRCHCTHFPRLSKAGGVDSLAPKQDWLHKTRRATAPTNYLSSDPSEHCPIWWGGRGAASRATFGALTRCIFCFSPSTVIFANCM